MKEELTFKLKMLKYMSYPFIDFLPYYISLLVVLLTISTRFPDPNKFYELLIFHKFIRLSFDSYFDFCLFFKFLYYIIFIFFALISNGKAIIILSKNYGNNIECRTKKDLFFLILNILAIWSIDIPNIFFIIENGKFKILWDKELTFYPIEFVIIMSFISIFGIKKGYPIIGYFYEMLSKK